MSKLKLPVEEFTTPEPIVAGYNDTYDQLFKLMRHHGIQHLPVIDAGQVVGLISDRDLRVLQLLSPSEKNIVRASDIMSIEPVTVNCSTPLEEVAFIMSQLKIGSVIVSDENGDFYGIFTLTEALNALIEIIRDDRD